MLIASSMITSSMITHFQDLVWRNSLADIPFP